MNIICCSEFEVQLEKGFIKDLTLVVDPDNKRYYISAQIMRHATTLEDFRYIQTEQIFHCPWCGFKLS